jgi:hypothetical protein
MAGRGTDIRLGAGIADKGGLHVIATELHESARIDRQLFGRCGRQGDPGSTEAIVSLEDELIRLYLGAGFGPDAHARIGRVSVSLMRAAYFVWRRRAPSAPMPRFDACCCLSMSSSAICWRFPVAGNNSEPIPLAISRSGRGYFQKL